MGCHHPISLTAGLFLHSEHQYGAHVVGCPKSRPTEHSVSMPGTCGSRKEDRIMHEQSNASPAEVIGRLHRAMNRRDLRAFLDCFDSDYKSEQPVHPNRGFGGREQVERNWSALFDGIPDFHAELIAAAAEGDTLWSEWHWTGTRAGETPLDMRGVTLFRIEDGRIVSGRLYMEEVEEAGGDIDETVRSLTEGTRSQGK
jgi:ketosteroid isomerase-like protein